MAKMNEILQSELGAEIKSSPVIAFACDESTDVSVKENMVVYVYYIKNGEAKTVFLGMVNVKGAATAANLKAALKSALDVHGVYARAVAFGADGASAMLGINGGVAAKLRDDGKPHLLVFHCVCHRLALSAADSAKDVPFAADLGKFVQATYNVFSRSASRRDTLADMAKQYDEGKTSLKKQHAVRWLSRAGALEAMVKNINTLADFIIDELSDHDDESDEDE